MAPRSESATFPYVTLRQHLKAQTQIYLIELYNRHKNWSAVYREAGISEATLYRKLPRCKHTITCASRRARHRLMQTARTSRPGMVDLLRFFGVPVNGRVRDRQAALREARHGYLAKVKLLHPDVAGGGDVAQLAAVNQAWSDLERLVARDHRG